MVIKSTPFRMAFGLEAVLLVEFHVSTLRVQVIEILDEEQSERVRKEQFLILEESRFREMSTLLGVVLFKNIFIYITEIKEKT